MRNKNILYISIIVSLFFIPILMANVYYLDDIGRATNGYYRWSDNDGRPLSDLIMYILNFGGNQTDIYPLPTILSIIFLIISLYRMQSLFDDKNSIFTLIVASAFFINPFMAENFSYRFDVLPMVSGILLSVLVFTIKIRNNTISFLTSVIFIVSIYSTYQTNINIFVILTIIEFIRNSIDKDDALKILLFRFFQFIIGSIIYIKIIMPMTMLSSNPISHPNISIFNIIETIKINLYEYNGFLSKNFIFNWGYFIILTTIINYISIIFIYIKKVKNKNTLTFIVFILCPIIAYLMCFGSLLALEKPIYWFPRVYIGLCGYFIFCYYLIYKLIITSLPSGKKILFVLFIPVLANLSFFYTYGNSLKNQFEFSENVISEIKSKVDHNDIKGKGIYYIGNELESPVFKNSYYKFNLIRHLVPTFLGNGYWGFKFSQLNGLNVSYKNEAEARNSLKIDWCRTGKLINSVNFDLIITENLIIVDTKKQCNK